jgi:hypothetical protein
VAAARITKVGELPGGRHNWSVCAFRGLVILVNPKYRPRILTEDGKLEVLTPLPLDDGET